MAWCCCLSSLTKLQQCVTNHSNLEAVMKGIEEQQVPPDKYPQARMYCALFCVYFYIQMKVPPCQQSLSVVWIYSVNLLAAALAWLIVQQTSGPCLCYQFLAWGFWQGAASHKALLWLHHPRDCYQRGWTSLSPVLWEDLLVQCYGWPRGVILMIFFYIILYFLMTCW